MMNRITQRWWIGAFAPLLVAGCVAGTASESADAQRPRRAPPPPTEHIPPVSPCTSQAPAPRALRRLTQAELNSTVADLLGGDPNAPRTTDVFSGDPVNYGFHNIQASLSVRDNGALAVQTYAEAVAAYAATHLSAV
ncbi:MAG TPA: DUF1587 domain-containing protein, partial [Myxococcota bacterium]|nr:DUF1587 domain-containing protein [Myxococcota bacterium]